MANAGQQQLFDSLKDKFQGFDKNGNIIVKDGEDVTSFDKNDFKDLADLFRQANPDHKEGSYEANFNKNQFQDLEKQGNKFQGLDQSGNSIYRNEQGDLENFGQTGGFADYAKSNLAENKFSMANQGVKNQVQGENTVLNPMQQRKGLGAVANMQKAANNISRPDRMQSQGENSTNPAPQPGQSFGGGFKGFQRSQMEKNAEQQNKTVQQAKATPQQTQTPSLTGMAAGFAKQQAEKGIKAQTAPVLQQANAQATQATQPYIQQGQAAKNQAGQAIQQATGINPFSSIQNQAVNKAAEATGIDSGILNQGIGAIANPQQAIQSLAKQQVANNVSNLISQNTGADAGLTSGLVGAAMSGNVGQAATGLAKQQALNYAQNFAKQQLANTALGSSLNAIPGGVGSAVMAGKALFGGGSSSDKAKAMARAAAASATGGLSELVSPEAMAAGAGAATNLKDSKDLNKMGVAGDAVKGIAGLTAGNMNAVKDVGNIAMNNIGAQGATTSRALKGAQEGIKNLTQGNIGEGLKGLGSTAIKTALDTFIKNPANLIGNLGSAGVKTVGKVLKALNIFCFDGETKILMADRSYKKIKDLKVDDEIFLGGKVTAIGTAKVQGLYNYNGIKVSSDHAVFERGVWKRIKNTEDGEKLHENEVEVYPISTENHLVITEGGQIFADMDEVDDTYNKTDDQIIKELNKNVKRNKVLNAFHKTFIGKI